MYAVPGEYAHAEVHVKNDTLYFSLLEKPEFNVAIHAGRFASILFCS